MSGQVGAKPDLSLQSAELLQILQGKPGGFHFLVKVERDADGSIWKDGQDRWRNYQGERGS
jgi:hypothetical protein